MTHKEAADQLRDLMQDIRSLIIDAEYSDKDKKDIEALQLGINAIEQAEKGETANWIISCDSYYPFCSECGEEPPGREMSRYCPNCGRRMITRRHGK
jgi:Zn finger protein HypA/HybF involved in hydrogenase expression